jgi:hypothetical protein
MGWSHLDSSVATILIFFELSPASPSLAEHSLLGLDDSILVLLMAGDHPEKWLDQSWSAFQSLGARGPVHNRDEAMGALLPHGNGSCCRYPMQDLSRYQDMYPYCGSLHNTLISWVMSFCSLGSIMSLFSSSQKRPFLGMAPHLALELFFR